MTEESKISKAQQKAVNKYVKNNYDRINVTFPKGQKAIIKAHADLHEESVNAFITRSVNEAISRDTGQPIPQKVPEPEQTTPSKAPRPSNTVLKAFTDEDAQRVDLPRLLRDFRYQFEIQDLYGKAVLSDLLTKARATID